MPAKPIAPLAAVLATLALALAVPAAADAGTYSVRQCDHAAGIGEHDFAWHAAGSPGFIQYPGSGCGEFGLALRGGNFGHTQTYPSGGYAGYFAYAPHGTVFTRFSGMFGTFAWCCINGAATYAEATQHPNGSGEIAYLFQGNLGNDTFGPPSGVGGPIGRAWNASSFAAKRVGFQIRCGPGFSCPQLTNGDLRLRGRSFEFTLRDDVLPAIGASAGDLLAGGWLRGSRLLGFGAEDQGGGLAAMSAAFDGGLALSAPLSCAIRGGSYVRLQPCPTAHWQTWLADTEKLPDGRRTVTLAARDAGGNVVRREHSVLVDNTAPAAPQTASLEGGDGWRPANGFRIRWATPPGQHAPIAAALYRACPVGGGACATGRHTGEGISTIETLALPHAGEWDLRLWLEDAAGNADSGAATPPLRLRLDPEAPRLVFRAAAPDRPMSIVVDAADRSGIVDGRIEIRPRGQGRWTRLATSIGGGAMVATIDDSVRRGTYELRARAVDRAGNEAMVEGPPRTLAARTRTAIAATATVRRRSSAGSLRVARGRLVRIRARLSDAGDGPLAGRTVAVSLASRDRVVALSPRRSDGDGRIAFAIRARRSMSVRLRFAGDSDRLPAGRSVALRVPASSTIRRSRAVVRAGGAVVLRGRVRGGALPRRGKLVEIQAHFRGRWRTISTVRSAFDGRWGFRYAFGQAGPSARYRFRVRIPEESRYPFEAGTSKAVRVTVRSR